MPAASTFPGKVGLQQRVFPAYRAPFFDALAQVCQGGLNVFAGKALPEENIHSEYRLESAGFTPARNRNIFPITSPFYQCWQGGLLHWLERQQPDALIVEASPRYPSTRLAIAWMHRRGRPVLGWGLGAPPFSKERFIDKLILPWRRRERLTLLRSLDGLIAYSRRGAREYEAAGFPPDRIFIAPNAVSPRPSGPPPDRPSTFLEKPAVLFVGRLQARKRIEHLLHACACLPPRLRPRLWIAGDGPAREELEILAGQVYPQAEFLGDRRGSDLEALFLEADLFVLPGTGGLAVQQAMAYALPVIVAQGDGTQDDLVRPENGLRIPAGDLPALAGALRTALSNVNRLRQMGAESYRIVSEEINLEEMVKAFLQALHAFSGDKI